MSKKKNNRHVAQGRIPWTHKESSERKNRGVQDVLVICVDGLTGIKEAISVAFPKMEYQRCLVRQIRNTFKYVADKDRKEFAADLKGIHNAPKESQGAEIRDRVAEKRKAKESTRHEELVHELGCAHLKVLYLAALEATRKWTMPIRNWGAIYGEFCIMFEGRLPE